MSKPATRSYSRHSLDAVALLGHMIRLERIDRQMTLAELAARADISRGLLQRIESGDPGCSIGAAFEVAVIVGVRLFEADQSRLATTIASHQKTLALLPQKVRSSRKNVKDDF